MTKEAFVRELLIDFITTLDGYASHRRTEGGLIGIAGRPADVAQQHLLGAGLVDRFRVVMFPVITGATGSERIYDGYPDVSLDMIDSRTFDGQIQLVEYRPRVLDRPNPAQG